MNCHAVFNCVGHNHELSDNRLIKETVLKYVNEAEFKELFTIAALEKIETVTSSAIAATSSAIKASLDARNAVNDLTIQTIDFVNDAINNTAIEGGVLADTFVVVDGSLSQRTINKGLESISDLSTINNPKDGLRILVKSYYAGLNKGGGVFIYDSTKVDINDGGYTLNGWVRQVEGERLTPQMFGAKADGVTFDTKAIMDCIASARDNNKVIWMGGTENVYLVKHTNPKNEFNFIFNITEGFKMRGDGATIKAKQDTLPDLPNAQYALFRVDRPASESGNYRYIVKGIEFTGINMDGGYIYENDLAPLKLEDKHKLKALYIFEVRTQGLVMRDCEFRDFGQNNVIGSWFSSSFNTYGIGNDIVIDKCKFINNGWEGDHSSIYFMDDNVRVTRCEFLIDKAHNTFGSHAIEFHGKNSSMEWCTVENYVGGLIFGTNTQSGVGSLDGCSAIGNTMTVYSGAFSIWSGEVVGENGLSGIKINLNTATMIDVDGKLLEKGEVNNNKAFLATPILGTPFGSVSATNNTIISKATTKVYGVDFSAGVGIQPELIDFSNNALSKCQSAVRVRTPVGATNNIYSSIKVHGNNHYHYGDNGSFNLVEILTENTNASVIKSISMSDNSVFTYFPNRFTLVDVISGQVESIVLGNNAIPNGARILNLNGHNKPIVTSSQKLNVADYLALPESSAYSTKSSEDTLVFKIPTSSMTLNASGTSLSKTLGFITNNTLLVQFMGRLSSGFAPSTGIDVTSDFLIDERKAIANATISNKPNPVWGGVVGFDVAYSDNATKRLTITFDTYDAATLLELKNSDLVVTVEVIVRKFN